MTDTNFVLSCCPPLSTTFTSSPAVSCSDIDSPLPDIEECTIPDRFLPAGEEDSTDLPSVRSFSIDYEGNQLKQRQVKRDKGHVRTDVASYSKNFLINQGDSTPFTGNYMLDYQKLRAHFHKAGYEPNRAKDWPPALLSKILETYLRTGKLISYFKVQSKYMDSEAIAVDPIFVLQQLYSELDNVPNTKGRKVRKILLSSLIRNHCLPAFQNSLTQSHSWNQRLAQSDMFQRTVQDSINMALSSDQVKITLGELAKDTVNEVSTKVGESVEQITAKVRDQVFDSVVMKQAGENFGGGVISGIKNKFCEYFSSTLESFSNTFSKFSLIISRIWPLIAVLVAVSLIVFFGIKLVLYAFPNIFGPSVQVDKATSDNYVLDNLNHLADWLGHHITQIPKYFKFSDSPQFKLMKDSITVMVFFEKLANAAKAVGNMFGSILDWGCAFFTGEPFFDSTKKLQKLYVLLDNCLDSINRATNYVPLADQAQYVEDYQQLTATLPFLFKSDKTRFNSVSAVLALKHSQYETYLRSITSGSCRQEPVELWFTGPAGISKSNTAECVFQLVFNLLKRDHPFVHSEIKEPEWKSALVGLKNASDSFWSNYNKNWAFIMDDVFQYPDPEIVTAEAQILIMAKQRSRFALPTAEVHSKGKLFFESKIMAITTNAAESTLQTLIPGINHQAAFQRRRDFVIEMTGNSDPDQGGTVNQWDGVTFNVSQWDFKQKKHIHLFSEKGSIALATLAEKVVQRYLSYHRFHHANLKLDLSSILDKVPSTVGQMPPPYKSPPPPAVPSSSPILPPLGPPPQPSSVPKKQLHDVGKMLSTFVDAPLQTGIDPRALATMVKMCSSTPVIADVKKENVEKQVVDDLKYMPEGDNEILIQDDSDDEQRAPPVRDLNEPDILLVPDDDQSSLKNRAPQEKEKAKDKWGFVEGLTSEDRKRLDEMNKEPLKIPSCRVPHFRADGTVGPTRFPHAPGEEDVGIGTGILNIMREKVSKMMSEEVKTTSKPNSDMHVVPQIFGQWWRGKIQPIAPKLPDKLRNAIAHTTPVDFVTSFCGRRFNWNDQQAVPNGDTVTLERWLFQNGYDQDTIGEVSNFFSVIRHPSAVRCEAEGPDFDDIYQQLVSVPIPQDIPDTYIGFSIHTDHSRILQSHYIPDDIVLTDRHVNLYFNYYGIPTARVWNVITSNCNKYEDAFDDTAPIDPNHNINQRNLHLAVSFFDVVAICASSMFTGYVVGLLIYGVICLIYKGLEAIGLLSKEQSSFINDSSDVELERAQATLRTAIKKVPGRVKQVISTLPHSDGDVTSDNTDSLTGSARRVMKNLYLATIKVKGRDSMPTHDIWIHFVSNNIALMCTHYFAFGEILSMDIYPVGNKEENYESVSWSDVTVLRDCPNVNGIYSTLARRDLTAVYIPGIRHRCDMTRQLMSQKDFPSIRNVSGISRLEFDNIDGSFTISRTVTHEYPRLSGLTEPVTITETNLGVQLADYAIIDGIPGGNGLCMSPYMPSNTSVPSVIYGYHVASYHNAKIQQSMFAPFFKEDLVKVKATFENMPNIKSDITFNPPPDPIFKSDNVPINFSDESCEFLQHSRVAYTIDRNVSWSQKSKLIPTNVKTGTTKLKAPYPEDKIPADLSRTAANLALRKLNGKVLYHDDQVFSDPRVFEGSFRPNMKKDDVCRFLSFQQCVEGVTARGNIHSTDVSKASGFPYNTKSIKKSDLIKRDHSVSNIRVPTWYFDFSLKPELIDKTFFKEKDEPGLWVDPELQSWFYWYHYWSRLGYTPPAFYSFALKDELRPVQRVKDHHSRYFNVGELAHQLFCKSVFGYYISALEQTMDGTIKLGINPISHDWALLFRKLTNISNRVTSQDVSGWDLRYQVNYFKKWVHRFRTYFHLSIDDIFFLCVKSAFVSTFLVFLVIGNKVVVFVCMPSGCLMTSVWNSCFNDAEHRQIWYWLDDRDFDKLNGLAIFGDDSLLASQFNKRYNGITIAAFRKIVFNHECTEQDKTDTLKESIPIEEAVFLQRSFRERNGLMFAPLNPDSIRSMTQYIMKPDPTTTVQQQTAVNLHNALREWALHSEEDFQRELATLQPFLLALGPKYVFTETYDDLCSAFCQLHAGEKTSYLLKDDFVF